MAEFRVRLYNEREELIVELESPEVIVIVDVDGVQPALVMARLPSTAIIELPLQVYVPGVPYAPVPAMVRFWTLTVPVVWVRVALVEVPLSMVRL